MARKHGFPQLYHGRPDWPSRDDSHLFWLGLHTQFQFAHHPAAPDSRENAADSQHDQRVPATNAPYHTFCKPRHLCEKLVGLITKSTCGSILVTGYRGVGKTSLVNLALKEISDAKERLATSNGNANVEYYLRVCVNLSTVTSAHEVLILTYDALQRHLLQFHQELASLAEDYGFSQTAHGEFEYIENEIKRQYADLRASATVETRAGAQGFARPGEDKFQPHNPFPTQHTYNREALSRHQAILVENIERIRNIPHYRKPGGRLRVLHPIFVFDELDKLLPLDSAHSSYAEGTALDETPQARKLAQLQRIVAELKFFFSQSPSHQILIAGKDVDDSWSEDQNRGSGLFESIFVANLHVPSIFTGELEPCRFGLGERIYEKAEKISDLTGEPIKPEKELEDYYEILAREIGIARNSWSYNTALLILPYLAEYETFQLLLRAKLRDTDDRKLIKKWTEISLSGIPYSPREGDLGAIEPETGVAGSQAAIREKLWEGVGPMSERSCRRLNTLILYLTYKGRGIPRKILREFYDTILTSDAAPREDPGHPKLGAFDGPDAVRYLIAFPQHHLQKMNFYATVVATLDLSFSELRGLNDKGRVAIFHVLDYILKFYATGFSLRDLDHANFMTAREELFPSRQLATLILRLLDGRLWRRKDPRSPEYRLLHNVVHDLSVMFLRYGPEQSELRHTQSDFREEIQRLQAIVANVQVTPPQQRTAPVHAQIRLARIYEMTGSHHEARLGYYRALRWLRADIAALERDSHENGLNTTRTDFTRSFITAPATYAIEVLLAVGRLHEETGEHPSAIQHYLEAQRIYHFHACLPTSGTRRQGEDGNEKMSKDSKNSIDPPGRRWLDVEELCMTLLPGDHPDFNELCESIRLILRPKYPVTPLELYGEISGLGAGLHGIAAGLIETHNHTAIAYAKLWENVSSNLQLLQAMIHLREIGDEYGVVDQMFLIGQMMVRRRDFRAAALWYLAAHQNIRMIHNYSEMIEDRRSKFRGQTGAQWQTHSAAAGTEVQILAALGDVWFATDGVAFLSAQQISDCQQPPETSLAETPALDESERQNGKSERARTAFQIYQEIRRRARGIAGEISESLRIYTGEDRIEEYFHTQARYLFQSTGDTYNANDIYLRQLEVRADIIRQSSVLLDHFSGLLDPESGECKANYRRERYRFLNSWRYFWRGARVLLFRNLTVVGAVARNASQDYGRVNSHRRMGNLLRLIGTVLAEMTLHAPTGVARRLLKSQAVQNSRELDFKEKMKFYDQFISDVDDAEGRCEALSYREVLGEMRQREKELNPSEEGESRLKDEAAIPEKVLLRVGVRSAAVDIQRIFDYIRGRRGENTPHGGSGKGLCELEGEELDRDITRIDFLSPLFRIGGSVKVKTQGADGADGKDGEDAIEAGNLPLAEFYLRAVSRNRNTSLRKNLRLLLLSEQALLSSFINFRDSIPDYGYAASILATAEMYLIALYLFGSEGTRNKGRVLLEKERSYYSEAFRMITATAKRYIVKAIDTLKRERDQNRNTFHLISEAHFNLGDLLLIRFAALPRGASEPNLCEQLFGFSFLKPEEVAQDESDRHPEDIKRQIWGHYREGIILVQAEMDELFGRYRFPPDVYHAHRNVMDPVLHHRICKAARTRHAATRPHEAQTPREGGAAAATGFDPAKFDEDWDRLSQIITNNVPSSLPDNHWLEDMMPILKVVNSVRSDRGPLKIVKDIVGGDKTFRIDWIDSAKLDQLNQMVLFFESYRPGLVGR